MKRFLYFIPIAFFSFFIAVTARAQVAVTFGPEAGFSASGLNYVDEDFMMGIGVHGGGTAHIQLGRSFAIRPSVLLKFGFFQNADLLDKKTTTLTRIAVPLAFMYSKNFSNNNQLYFGAGPQVMYAIAGQTDYNDEYTKRKMTFGNDESDDLKPLDLGLHIKAGFNFSRGLGLNIFFNHGFNDIDPREGYKIKSVDLIGFSCAWLFGSHKAE
jgi:hypothetical protein